MKEHLVETLEALLGILVALAFCLILIVCIAVLPIGILLEDLNCWAQKKANARRLRDKTTK